MRASDSMLRRRSTDITPRLRLPAVPTTLLIERIRRDENPCPPHIYAVLCVEVAGFLTAVGVLALVGIRPGKDRLPESNEWEIRK